MRIDHIHLINDGNQIIGLAGSTLYDLEKMLKPAGKEPHSVIGSTSIGASIVGLTTSCLGQDKEYVSFLDTML